MVRNIIRRITAPIRGLHQAAYLLAGLTLASQVLALMRDRIFAHQFGAGEMLDLYYAAFKVPDLVFALIASLVSAYVLIPRIAGKDKEETRRLLSHTASFLFVASGIACAVLALLAPTLLFALFPNFADSPAAGEFVMLARILLIQPILLGLSGIITSVTQVHRRFALYALSPVLYNLGIIGGTLFLYPQMGLVGIGYGVVIGAFLHLIIHIPLVVRAGLLPRPVLFSPQVVWSVAKDSVPRSLALAAGAASLLALTAIAATTGEGNIAVFTLAGNLEAVPLSLIGVSYATAAFPVLAEHVNAKRYAEYRATLLTAARHIIFWSAIVSVIALVLRAHIVRIVLGSGAFDWDATRLTAAILAILVIGLVAQGLTLLASRAFYAAGRSWNPLLIQLGGAAVSIAGALVMVAALETLPVVRTFVEVLLRVEDVPGTGILAVALGATLGQIVMAAVALATLRNVAPGIAPTLTRALGEGLAAGILGAAATYGVLSYFGTLAPLTTLPIVFAEGLVAGMVGLAVAAAVLALLANQEFRELVDSLQKMSGQSLKPHAVIENTTD